MREFTILKPEIQDKIRTNIFSSVENVNSFLGTSIIVDDINFFDVFVSIRIGSTKFPFVPVVALNSLCRNITECFISCGVVVSSCRIIGVNFEDNVIHLAVNL